MIMNKTSSRVLLLVSVILGIASFAWAGECCDYRQTFQPPTSMDLTQAPTGLATDGSMALLLIGQEIHCYDFSTPAQPDLRGVLDLGVVPVEVVSNGQLATILTADSLLMLDWSDPAAMQVTLTIPRPAGLESMHRQDDWLVLCLGADGIAIHDCSVPGALPLVSSLDTPDHAVDAVLHDGYLLVADTSAILTVNIEDPAAPVIASTYTEDSSPDKPVEFLAVDSDGTFVLQSGVAVTYEFFDDPYGGEFYERYGPVASVFDATPLGQLSRRNQWQLASDDAAPAIRGGRVHTAGEDFTLTDITGDEPSELLRAALAADAVDFAAGDLFDLVATADGAVQVLDLRFPFYVAPSVVWDGPAFHDIAGGAVRPGWLMKSNISWSGMSFSYEAYLYSTVDPDQPVEVWDKHESGATEERVTSSLVATDGPHAIIGNHTSMGDGYELVTVGGAQPVSTRLALHGVPDLAGDRIFQRTDGWDSPVGLAYLDIGDPANIVQLGFLAGTFYSDPFALDETTVLVETTAGIQLVDFSDPGAPAVRGVAEIACLDWLARDGDRVYFRSSEIYLSALDVGDPDDLCVAWNVAVSSPVVSMVVEGDMAVLVHDAEPGYLQVVDPGGEVGPVAVSEPFATSGDLRSACWYGGYLYTNTLAVDDMNTPAAPAYLGCGTGSTGALYADADWLVTGAGLYPLQCGGVTAIDDITDPIPSVPEAVRLLAVPNPFNPQTTVKFDLPWDSQVKLDVFDVRGRRVRTLTDERMTAGSHGVTWDGRDDAGRSLASGVYLARLATDRRATTARLVLVR